MLVREAMGELGNAGENTIRVVLCDSCPLLKLNEHDVMCCGLKYDIKKNFDNKSGHFVYISNNCKLISIISEKEYKPSEFK